MLLYILSGFYFFYITINHIPKKKYKLISFLVSVLPCYENMQSKNSCQVAGGLHQVPTGNKITQCMFNVCDF